MRAGQKIGELGNSGASLAPHLHFHVVNGPHIAACAQMTPSPRTDQLPLDFTTVNDFPG